MSLTCRLDQPFPAALALAPRLSGYSKSVFANLSDHSAQALIAPAFASGLS